MREAGEHAEHGHAEEAAGFCETAACLRNWKIAFAAILFVEGVIFGYVAIALRRFACLSTKKFFTLLSYVNTFGGGIFLATGLLHIIPEALEFMEGGHSEEEGAHGDHDAHSLNTAAGGDEHDHSTHAEAGHEGHEEGGHGFPLGFTLILVTFLVFLFFDRILFTHHNHGHSDAKHVTEEGNDEDVSMRTVRQWNRNSMASQLQLSIPLLQ